MSVQGYIAVVITLATIYALVRRYETRLMLLTSGLLMCLIALNPMGALNQFAKQMTNASLIMAICSAMGFAAVCSLTKADHSLVHYLTRPIKGLGLFLIPISTVITFLANIAIPSAAGCAAAVAPTLIPVMLRAGIKPVGAAAAVMAGTIGSLLSPGTSHNVFIANLAHMQIVDFIATHFFWDLIVGALVTVGVFIVCLVMGDHKQTTPVEAAAEAKKEQDFQPSPVLAWMPVVPIAILVVGNLWWPVIHMGVAQAMLVGAILTVVLAIFINHDSPQELSRRFFQGTGKGYADVMGLIISASVFACGLRECGLVSAMIEAMQQSSEIARWGGSIGPFVLAVLCGSGDAATLAFNEAVTPSAPTFGMQVPQLGALAFLSGALGRTMSPLAAGMIVICGIAQVNPFEVAKRTALPCIIAMLVIALLMV